MTDRITQLFMLADGTWFEWQGEVYKLLSCDDNYHATVLNSLEQTENFNGCAHVKTHDPVKLRAVS